MKSATSLRTFARASLVFLVPAALAWACGGSGALGAPKSDSQFDDNGDPGSGPGGNGGSAPDASGDAQGRACVADRDCPASHRFLYAISAACSATGACMLFSSGQGGCDASPACGCNNQDVSLCGPAGFASAPISRAGSCSVPDASVPDTSVPDTSVPDTGVVDAAAD